MTYFLAAWSFVKTWWPFVVLAAITILLLILVSCAARRHSDPIDTATIKVQSDVADATSNSSAARVEDAVKAEQQKEEINDAIENSSGSDDARRRSGCVILRQQGRDTSGIPACR